MLFDHCCCCLFLHALQVAVYKDHSGDVHKFSGLCPHLGCLLQVQGADTQQAMPPCCGTTATNFILFLQLSHTHRSAPMHVQASGGCLFFCNS